MGWEKGERNCTAVRSMEWVVVTIPRNSTPYNGIVVSETARCRKLKSMLSVVGVSTVSDVLITVVKCG